MNKLSTDKKIAVVSALVEGCSVRSTSRLTGVATSTILRLLEEVGTACAQFQNITLRNLPCKRVQVIWAFCYAKQKNVTPKIADERVAGDAWTWVAIDADTKLVASWLVGQRDAGFATEFIQDLASRLANRVQLTSDGLKLYVNAIMDSFADDIDYAQLIKIYGNDPEGHKRYSPAPYTGAANRRGLGRDPGQEPHQHQHEEREIFTMRVSVPLYP